MSNKKASKGKKRSRAEDEPEVQPVFVAHELRDLTVLGHIHELRLPMDVDRAVTSMYSQMMDCKVAHRTERTPVEYRPAEFKDGRLYGAGLQCVSGWIRRILGYKYYHDVDMKNAGPMLFSQLAKKALGECPAIIEEYARDRRTVFERVRANGMPDASDELLKELFLVTMHGGNYANQPGAVAGNPVLDYFRKNIRRTARKLWLLDQYKEIRSQITEAKKKDATVNETGRFLSYICQQAERAALLAMAEYFVKSGRVVGTLIHDGLQLERTDVGSTHPLSSEWLRGAEKAILSATSFTVDLVEKPMTPTEEDWAMYNGPKVMNKIAGPLNQQIELMVQHASSLKLVRSDGYVWSLHPRVKGVFVVGDEAVSFINNALGSHPAFRGADMKVLTSWFNTNEHPRFQLLTPDKFGYSIAFQNGYFDLEALLWHADDSPPLATKHFFDQFLDDELLTRPTPLWDSLLEHQLGSRSRCSRPGCGDQATFQLDGQLYCRAPGHAPEGSEPAPLALSDMLEVLIGRLFYPVGKHDQWQVMPFMKGDADTGKSTLIEIVSEMFPIGTSGTIGTNTEKKYGLESLEDKRIVCIPDMPANISQIVSQGDFQSMITGERVTVARKYKTAVSNQPWTVPMLAAGNFIMDYKDAAGSLSRRLAVFSFINLIEDRNTLLKRDVIKDELVNVMIRCIVSYRQCAERNAGKGFWEHVAPAALKATKEDVKEQTNYLARFIKNGSTFYQIQFIKGSVTKLEDLEKAFSNHMKFDMKIERMTIGADHHAIKAAGFTVKRTNICKICNLEFRQDNCGDHYDRRNNCTKTVIVDMHIHRAEGY